ncbi:MAG TPA: molecular chaperone DnaJ [Acidimicrobiales bacterium]|nr:molecular chaperone DnaJ [Acidimicrobiales bacterium]
MAPQREWFETDYYKVLGVSPQASEKELTRAYRKLAKQYHPDANPGAEDRFKEITAAYDVLGDADKRKEYDEVRRLGAAGNPFATNGGPSAGFGNFRVEDLFTGIFRQPGGPGRRRASTGVAPQRGADIEAELHLSFDEAIEGVVTSVNVTSHAPCHTCGGSGSRPGSSPVVCPRCGGTGVINDNQGLFSLSSPCPECGGRGTKIVDPCPTCFGTGVERRQRQVKVRIPAGVEEGQRIRAKGRGEPGRNGGPAGDLFVTVRVKPHPLFGRRGRDLTLTVPITFPEATLGATITVPSLESRTVSLKIPAGTRNGKTFRVRDHGVRNGNQHGDLLVSVEIAVPAQLSPEERAAIEALAAATHGSPRDYLQV